MRVKSVNYWFSIISAEKENASKNIKEPKNDNDLNYQTAKYYVSQTETNNHSKVA